MILTEENCVLLNSVQELSLHSQLSPLYIPLLRIKEYMMLEKCYLSKRHKK